MADTKKMAVFAAGAALALAGIVGTGAGLAGATQAGDPLQHATGAVHPDAVPISPGTYDWYISGSFAGQITINSGNTFTSDVYSTDDSGTWVQAGETFGLWIDSGTDAGAGCVFAGHVLSATTVSYAAKPGHWACPGYSSSGTFYIAPAPASPSAAPARGDAFSHSDGVLPLTAGKIGPGTYKWTEDGYYSGKMTVAAGNTYTSTLSGDDAGSYVQSGSAFAFDVGSGYDSGIGCLEVGKVNKTGTAVGTTAKPGNWACPGTSASGYFVLVKKG